MRGTPMDELFTRYMYYRRAKKGIRDTTTASLRDFFSADAYAILKEEGTLADLGIALRQAIPSTMPFPKRVYLRLFVLNYAPNGMWTYLVSVWFLANRDEGGALDEGAFYDFLNFIRFIFAFPSRILATPRERWGQMVSIVKHEPVTFPKRNRTWVPWRFLIASLLISLYSTALLPSRRRRALWRTVCREVH